MATIRHLRFVGARIRTTHDDYLVVSIVVRNLVEIDEEVSIVCNFQHSSHLAWKCLFTPQKLVFLWDFTSKIGSNINETPKRHTLARAYSKCLTVTEPQVFEAGVDLQYSVAIALCYSNVSGMTRLLLSILFKTSDWQSTGLNHKF